MTKDTPKYIWPITVTTDRYGGGVCDFADRSKGDAYHKSCSYASAAFLYQMLREKF